MFQVGQKFIIFNRQSSTAEQDVIAMIDTLIGCLTCMIAGTRKKSKNVPENCKIYSLQEKPFFTNGKKLFAPAKYKKGQSAKLTSHKRFVPISMQLLENF